MNKNLNTLKAGFALFSMFFGAGNVTFPLLVGIYAAEKTYIAILGLFITAVFMPIVGFIAMILFRCDYMKFFHRLGNIPGNILIILSLALIGPFLGIPRTVAVAYSTVTYQMVNIPIWLFSAVFLLITYLCTYKQRKIIDIISIYLTPLLFLLIVIIVIKGMVYADPIEMLHKDNVDVLLFGIKEGYNTLDLVAALFFSSLILLSMQSYFKSEHNDDSNIMRECIKAGVIGGALLFIVYLGMSQISALYATKLANTQTETGQLIAALVYQILGNQAGPISSIIVVLACLTTAIGLCAVIADLIHNKYQYSYNATLLLVMVISYFTSLLGFSTIMKLVAPIIIICYPVYIVMSILNIGHKLGNINIIKMPALFAFLISVYCYLI